MNLKEKLALFALFILSNTLTAQDKSVEGEWSSPIQFGIVPVAVANLPNGNLITWSSQFRDTFIVEGDGTTFTELFDPFGGPQGTGAALGEFTSNTDHDMFCPGINNLADGRILSAGGTSSEKTSIYDWRTNSWTVADQMNIPRGYQGNVTLSDGSVFTIGGSWSGGNYTNRDAEIYTPLSGWLRLTNIEGEDISVSADYAQENQGAYRIDNHVWLWPAPNGKLFHAGPSEMMHWIDVDVPGGAIVEAGIRQDVNTSVRDYYSMKGNTVMFDIGKILKTGGARAYGDDNIIDIPAQDNSFVIDLNGLNFGDTPDVTFVGNMELPRTMHNSTVLPNGEVLITGGLQGAAVFTDETAVFGAELFSPNSPGNKWRTVAAMQTPRTYHSVAILMVDGRVFVGGGGLCDSSPGCENHMNAEIYSPPYLFNANGTLATRPEITNGPESSDYDTSITVTGTPGIQEFSLIRFSAATHSTNNEQRRIPVSFVDNGSSYDINIPQRELLPPGYYMLFALDASGVPSIAHTIQIGSELPLNNNSNLVLDMQFDETSGINAADNSQYAHNGTIVQRDDDGDTEAPDQYAWSDGIIGNALEFDGLEFNSNSLLEIDYSAELASTAASITVSAWVYRNSNSGIPEANGKIANVGILSHDYPNLFFGFHNTLYKWAFLADSPLDCYAGYAPLDTWVHLAATYDGTTAKLYANGVEVCSREVSGLIGMNDDGSRYSKFTASGFYDHRYDPDDPVNPPASEIDGIPDYGNTSGVTDEVSGKMDLLRVYNKVLDPAEIQALYQEGLNTNNPDIYDCAGDYLTAEYRIGLSGLWIEGNTISVPEGAEVFIRPKGYLGEYLLTTPQYDGPTYSNVQDASRFTADNAYQIDTFVTPAFDLAPWNNPDRNNGFVDASNEGQFVLTTPEGCPTTIYFSLIDNNSNGGCPNYLPNEDPTIFIVSGSLASGLSEATGTNSDTNNSECALEITNISENAPFSRFAASIKIADYGINIGDELYLELDGKGNNTPRLEVYRNNDPLLGPPLSAFSFGTDWGTFTDTFIVPASTETIDIWLYSNYASENPGTAFYDNLKVINLTATGGNLPPTAEFTANPLTGDASLDVNFDASASTDDVGINQYVWKFGDGTISSLQNPSHTYTEPGNYLVTLSVFDTGGLKDDKSIYILVTDPSNQPPVAIATADPTSGTVPLTVQFTGSASTDDNGIAQYAWDFGDGNSATTADPQHIFNGVGQFDVTLTVTDAQGETDQTTLTITVGDLPNQPPVAIATADPTSGTVPLTVQFTGSASTDDNGIAQYAWDFGDGNSATTADPQHIFNGVGQFDVTLTVTDAQGETDQTTLTITVSDLPNQPPVAIATADPTSGNVPLTVQFTGSASTDDNGIAQYAWDFGDGNSATTADPQHIFNGVGQFDVTLTVTDAQGETDQTTLTITVSDLPNQPPVAIATADPTSGTVPLTVQFTGSASTDDNGIAQYAWDFGDGNSATTADPQHIFNGVGQFDVTLTVTDAQGETDQTTLTITVSDLPNQPPVAIATADPTSGNVPLTVQFTGSASTDDNGIAQYAWDFGDGNSATTADPQHIFNGVGQFDVTLTVTDAQGETHQTTLTITVSDLPNQPPVAIATADPTSGTVPLTVQFTGSASTDDNGIAQYAWDFGDGNSATTADPQHIFNGVGQFDVTLTVTDAQGETHQTTLTITVSDLPNQPPVAIATADPTSGTVPLTVQFTGSASTDDNGIAQYAWDFGDGNSATTADPQHIFNGVGQFDVTLTVTDAQGETDQTTLTITVSDLPNQPPVAIATADPTSGTVPLTVQFTGSASTDDNGIAQYAWDFGDGNSATTADPQHIFNGVGQFDVTLTVTDAQGETDNVSLQIVVSENEEPNLGPTASFIADPVNGMAELTVNFDASQSFDDKEITSFIWDFGDDRSGVGEKTVHVFENPGVYTAILTVSDEEGLTSTTSTIITVLENTILTDKKVEDVVVYPNPVRNETLKIDLSAFLMEKISISFYDIYSKLIFQKIADQDHEAIIELDLAMLQNGMYLMELGTMESNQEYTIKKIIKLE